MARRSVEEERAERGKKEKLSKKRLIIGIALIATALLFVAFGVYYVMKGQLFGSRQGASGFYWFVFAVVFLALAVAAFKGMY